VGNGQLFAVACDEGSLNDIRVILGNDKANQAYREGKLPFPDGTIIARIALRYDAEITTKSLAVPDLSYTDLPST